MSTQRKVQELADPTTATRRVADVMCCRHIQLAPVDTVSVVGMVACLDAPQSSEPAVERMQGV